MSTRALTTDDIPAHAALLAAVEAADQLGQHYSEADLAEEYAEADLTFGGTFADDGALVGYWGVYPRVAAGSHLKVHLEGAVHPARRGEGIGTAQVAAMLARAAEAHAALAPELPAHLSHVGPQTDEALTALLTAAGLAPHRWSFSMRARLDGPVAEPAPLPAGHTLLTWTPELDEALRQAHNEVFLDHPDFTPWTPAMWDRWIGSSRTFRPDSTLLLVADPDPGRVVAYVQTSEFDAHTAVTGRREAHVARVGTRRELRGRGVAGALLGEALRRYRAAGYDEASLEVDAQNPTGALGVYERAGFTVERGWTVHAQERPPLPV